MKEDLNSKKMENGQTASSTCGSQAKHGSSCSTSQPSSSSTAQSQNANMDASTGWNAGQSTGACAGSNASTCAGSNAGSGWGATQGAGSCADTDWSTGKSKSSCADATRNASANANAGTSANAGTASKADASLNAEAGSHMSEGWSESWHESFAYDDEALPEYHQMSLSVTRFTNSEQTDIRIHRETGKSTEVYVSQGGEAWDLGTDELHLLPKELRKEVECLLNPSEASEKSHWWSSLLSFGQHSRQREMLRDSKSETLRDKMHEAHHDQPRETLRSGSSEKAGMCGKPSCEK